MKLTQRQLRVIIKEELNEMPNPEERILDLVNDAKLQALMDQTVKRATALFEKAVGQEPGESATDLNIRSMFENPIENAVKAALKNAISSYEKTPLTNGVFKTSANRR